VEEIITAHIDLGSRSFGTVDPLHMREVAFNGNQEDCRLRTGANTW